MEFPEPVKAKLSKLKPDKRNARKHSDRNIEEIVRSLQEFGQHRPFVVQKSTGKILVGNGMYEAMKQLGWTEGLALYVDDDDETAIKRALADNRTGELAEWDWPVLKDIVQELGPEPDIPGWSDEELKDFFDLSDFSQGDDGTEDECPEVPKEPTSKLGDIYALGKHRLICGDSTDEKTIERLMAGGKADLVFTDPPYGVSIGDKNKTLQARGHKGGITKNILNDDLAQNELYALLVEVFKIAKLYMKDCCACYVTAPQGGGLGMMMMMMMRDAGLQVRHILIWVKNQATFSLGRLDYDYQHESILFTWNKTHKKIMQGEHKTSCWFIDKPLASKLHPTMKPVVLVENAILNSSEKNDIVFDVFGGSGSTLIACEKTGRICHMAELAPGYCDVIVKRWEDFTGKKAELLTASE
jgi:DNA modification methylase